MSTVDTLRAESLLNSLPYPHSPHDGPIEEESLAWDMAIAQDPYESRRVHWEQVMNSLKGDPHGVFGRTDRKTPLNKLLPMIQEVRFFGLDDSDLARRLDDENVTDEDWLKIQVARFNYHAHNVIPNSFVTRYAEKLARHYRGESYVAAEAVHYGQVAPRTIDMLEKSLGLDGQEVFAPLYEEKSYRKFRYFRDRDVSRTVKDLEDRVQELYDIQRRKEAYFALARHFGGFATEETVTRQDVMDLSDILASHYVDGRLRANRF